jgi:L-asparaginase/Glu-tRNA(Gln) amidotransferase subunit D
MKIFQEPMQGIVLQTFGAGNFPSLRTDLVDVIRKSVKERGLLIVNISQCQRGEVDELAYATGEVK